MRHERFARSDVFDEPPRETARGRSWFGRIEAAPGMLSGRSDAKRSGLVMPADAVIHLLSALRAFCIAKQNNRPPPSDQVQNFNSFALSPLKYDPWLFQGASKPFH
jgi:hypothetical protein